jgi:hypothetical protein
VTQQGEQAQHSASQFHPIHVGVRSLAVASITCSYSFIRSAEQQQQRYRPTKEAATDEDS